MDQDPIRDFVHFLLKLFLRMNLHVRVYFQSTTYSFRLNRFMGWIRSFL